MSKTSESKKVARFSRYLLCRKLARYVVWYFGPSNIMPMLDSDIRLRDLALSILELEKRGSKRIPMKDWNKIFKKDYNK